MNCCRIMAIIVFGVSLMGLMAGCGECGNEGFDEVVLRERIEEANRVFVEGMKQGDVAAVTALYADDAVLLVPNEEIISGKDAIEAFWKKALEGEVEVESVFESVVVDGSGTVAYEIGKNVHDYTFPNGDK